MVKNSSHMDLSKTEKQAPTEQSRSDDPRYLRILLQDILCFFILLSLGMVIVIGILCVIYNVQYHDQHNHRHKTHMPRVFAADEPNKPEQPCNQRGTVWVRLFRIQRLQPQQDAKLEEMPELKQNLGHVHGQPKKLEEPDMQMRITPPLAPIYQHGDYHKHPQLQAGGESADRDQAEWDKDIKLEEVPEPKQNLGHVQAQPIKLEEPDKQMPITPPLSPTYQPRNYPKRPRLQAGGDQAGGDHAQAVNKLDSEPQPFLSDNF